MRSLEHWSYHALISAFTDALEGVAAVVERVEREPHGRSHAADAIVDVEIGDRRLRLIVEVKRTAYPRDAREAAYQLTRYRSEAHFGHDMVSVLIAESISTGGREILREEGIGYFDIGGSLFLKASGVFILIDKPVGKSAEKALASVFTGRRSQALQAVWAMEGQAFGVNEIAKRARVSAATASETLTALDRHDWVSSLGSGPAKSRRLVNPRGLLDAWSEHQRTAKSAPIRRYFVPGVDVASLIGRLDEACRAEHCLYAITGEAAAQVYTPYLSNVSQLVCRMQAGPQAAAVLERLGARTVREGWNLGVIETDSGFALTEAIEGACFSSPLQTYLDLLQSPGRARELADHLRAQRLERP
ncbi:hypothetical protein [Phenylobacterium sp. Root700]|uniref:hypothetical protein n=1 Tax=Phenylobacterium sp. Root700 TaxID=1736591 RepID=UPI000701709D|nr:hypothetical protein [Phenylobacterium sp. Root700]KRB49642.1 hypothetical protein ASE02_17705 [Phenylobacterium sp. Root700]